MNKTLIAAAVVGISVLFASSTVNAAAKTHIAGDSTTFWKLSKKYEVSIDSLMKANPNVKPSNIYKGLRLTIPAADKKAASAKTAAMLSANDTAKAASAPKVTALSGKSFTYSKSLLVKATAYTAAASENGGWAGLDYFGNSLKVGTVAVDPKMIPLGTKLYVTGYDYNGLPQGGMIATATDVGGSIKGNRIDIFVPDSQSKALKFGIQQVKIYILE
ncbi:3D domain-containing protein [Paenibacillus harenae]|uniref:3D (Asp-Asp-Asp) domain-containing protein n=1 Tax=Paenibacillus harenae TaxID=306543 RepID=A0ABT9U6M7_PAEHA|nr:3D domain-containing protein [Paenibacillus harenae]MDQ0115295.1 3D (Asp-Asp-Asp) domain-containing protein [Paenibacillus harenae]